MPTCPNCGATLPQDATSCSNCQATATIASAAKDTPNANSLNELNARLEKAMRRNELLTYAAGGLAVAIFVAIVALAFL